MFVIRCFCLFVNVDLVQVEKTTWDWELINTNKPIWSRKPKDVKDEEYNDFYKSFTKVTFKNCALSSST